MHSISFHDYIELLRRLTLPKIFNGFIVLISYYVSKLSGKAIQWGLPVAVSIEPTTSCNLRCPECPSGLRSFTREKGILREDFFRKTIEALHKKLWYLTFYFQGEPYLHPKFLEMVNFACKKGIYTATSTNAHYLNDENARMTVISGLSRLIISIDGVKQETYEMYRIGGNLEKVIEGIKNIIRWKRDLRSKTPHLILQFLVFNHNEKEMTQVIKLGRELGVNEVQFKTAQIYHYERGHEFIPQNKKFSRYIAQNDGTYAIKNPLRNHCWKLWHSCVITWDGKVVPCCFDKDAKHQLGNLQADSFDQVWKSQPYKEFRSSVLSSRKEVNICANCSEGLSLWK
jgi:radical SAM protein with 4Fe4S-binding SPASM domain